MNKITTTKELRAAIEQLEVRRTAELQELKDQVQVSYEKLKPANLIKSALSSSPVSEDMGSILKAGMGMAAGFLARKAVMGGTSGTLRQLLATLLQVGVSLAVSKNADGIQSKIMDLINVFRKKQDTEEEQETQPASNPTP